jgi:hypothetical protein
MKIPFIVILSHLLVITSLVYLHSFVSKTAPHRPLAVRTYVQMSAPACAPNKTALSLQGPHSPEEPCVQKNCEPPLKQAPVKKADPKSAAKPAAKKGQPNSPPSQQKLISIMQQSLNTLNTTNSTQKQDSWQQKGKVIGKLKSEALSFETNYEEELAAYLESLFSFPEKGEVKLKLTLTRGGGIQKIDIVHATSERNREYIEATFPSCSFLPFGSRFKGEVAHTFTIRLTSENSH